MQKLTKYIDEGRRFCTIYDKPSEDEELTEVDIYKEEGEIESQIAWRSDDGLVLVFKNQTGNPDTDRIPPEEIEEHGPFYRQDHIQYYQSEEE